MIVTGSTFFKEIVPERPVHTHTCVDHPGILQFLKTCCCLIFQNAKLAVFFVICFIIVFKSPEKTKTNNVFGRETGASSKKTLIQNHINICSIPALEPACSEVRCEVLSSRLDWDENFLENNLIVFMSCFCF